MRPLNHLTVFIATLLGSVLGHGGASAYDEMAAHELWARDHRMDLGHCKGYMTTNNHLKRAVLDEIKSLQKRELQAHDGRKALKTDHFAKEGSISMPPDALFDIPNKNHGCVLHEEAILGPFYVADELLRKYVDDSQGGIKFWPVFQVVDVKTCEPVVGQYLEIWHANATGTYSGVIGHDNVPDRPENWETNFHRGVQQTNENGVVVFYSRFPGPYPNRTVHLHVNVHGDKTCLAPDNRITGNTTLFRGQVFFDQRLIDDITQVEPYRSQKASILDRFYTNEADEYLPAVLARSDPMMNYFYFNGKDVTDGVISWIPIGVEMDHKEEIPDNQIAKKLGDGDYYQQGPNPTTIPPIEPPPTGSF